MDCFHCRHVVRLSMRFMPIAATAAGLLLTAGCNEEELPATASSQPMSGPPAVPMPAIGQMNTPFITPGIRQPEMHAVDQVSLPDDAEVIGCLAGSLARAYLLEALTPMNGHVVNDVAGTIPVSITYCDMTDSVRAFTCDQPGAPINLGIGGFMDGQMLLQLNGRMYPQKSADVPLTEHPVERTTWGAWKALHPESVIYLGTLAAAASSTAK